MGTAVVVLVAIPYIIVFKSLTSSEEEKKYEQAHRWFTDFSADFDYEISITRFRLRDFDYEISFTITSRLTGGLKILTDTNSLQIYWPWICCACGAKNLHILKELSIEVIFIDDIHPCHPMDAFP